MKTAPTPDRLLGKSLENILAFIGSHVVPHCKYINPYGQVPVVEPGEPPCVSREAAAALPLDSRALPGTTQPQPRDFLPDKIRSKLRRFPTESSHNSLRAVGRLVWTVCAAGRVGGKCAGALRRGLW